MNKRIVIADDEAHIRRVIELKLAAAGYAVSAATNASEGIELAQRLLPDLVISDYRMPGDLTGVDLIFRLREWPATRSTPIILLTGSVALLNRLQDELNHVPNVVLMSKPFSPRGLLQEVQSIFSAQAEQEKEL